MKVIMSMKGFNLKLFNFSQRADNFAPLDKENFC